MGRTVPPPPHKNKQQNPQLLNLVQSKPRGRERRKMTQKANLFKGQQKKKSVPPNRHGKPSVTRKGNYLALHVCVFCLWKIPVLDSMCICFCFFFLVCAGKRFVKPAKVTKEMDVDRVCLIFYSLSKYYFYFFFTNF